MSHITNRPDQSTSLEVSALAALTAMGVTPAGFALVKTGFATFGTVAVGVASLNPQTPVGTINGTNAVFTITLPLNALFLNGAFQTPGGVDYTLSGSTITYVSAPYVGSGHYAI